MRTSVGCKFIATSFIRATPPDCRFFSSGSFHVDSLCRLIAACGTTIAPISPAASGIFTIHPTASPLVMGLPGSDRICKAVNRVSSLQFLILLTGNK